MEIEPEHIPPSDRERYRGQTGPGVRILSGWRLVLASVLLAAVGIVLLFFVFWFALALTGVALIFLAVNRIRAWITGKPPGAGRQTVFRITLNK